MPAKETVYFTMRMSRQNFDMMRREEGQRQPTRICRIVETSETTEKGEPIYSLQHATTDVYRPEEVQPGEGIDSGATDVPRKGRAIQ